MVDVISVECPFCGSLVKALHRPAMVREKKKSSWGGSKRSFTRDEEVFEITEDCPSCGKTKKEIEYALKHGKEPTREDVIKRLRNAGLDPSRLK